MDAFTENTLQLREVETAFCNSRFVSLFQTTEPEHAEAYVANLYGPHALQLASSPTLDMRMRGFEFAKLHLGEIRYGSSAIASVSESFPCWFFTYLRQGVVRRHGDGNPFGPGEGSVTAPDTLQRLHMSADMELLNLRVTEHDMKSACRALLGAELSHELRFDSRAPAGGKQVGALLRVMSHLAATPVYAHQAARRFENSLRDAALYELLLAWPNSYASHLDQPAALPPTTRRARDYIHAHAIELPTVAEIARECGVGVRALTRGFEKHLSSSPLRYMQQYRLDRVRVELLAAPDSATVTDVAFKWGFMQLGSFAARYRMRFGESPSQTLRGPRH